MHCFSKQSTGITIGLHYQSINKLLFAGNIDMLEEKSDALYKTFMNCAVKKNKAWRVCF